MVTWTAEEYREFMEKGRKAPGSKMRNRRTPYNGREYDSKLEADTAAQLDLLVRAGLIRSWKAQESFELKAPSSGRESRSYNHRVDFMVFVDRFVFCLIECKGYETDRGKAKRALLEKQYEVRVHVIESPGQAKGVIDRTVEGAKAREEEV